MRTRTASGIALKRPVRADASVVDREVGDLRIALRRCGCWHWSGARSRRQQRDSPARSVQRRNRRGCRGDPAFPTSATAVAAPLPPGSCNPPVAAACMSMPSPCSANLTVCCARLPVTSRRAAVNTPCGVLTPVAAIATVTGRSSSATRRPAASGGATVALPSSDATAKSFPHTRLLPCTSTSPPRNCGSSCTVPLARKRTADDFGQSRDERRRHERAPGREVGRAHRETQLVPGGTCVAGRRQLARGDVQIHRRIANSSRREVAAHLSRERHAAELASRRDHQFARGGPCWTERAGGSERRIQRACRKCAETRRIEAPRAAVDAEALARRPAQPGRDPSISLVPAVARKRAISSLPIPDGCGERETHSRLAQVAAHVLRGTGDICGKCPAQRGGDRARGGSAASRYRQRRVRTSQACRRGRTWRARWPARGPASWRWHR